MSNEQHVTLGELYRLCQRIETQVIKTNGRVTDLETDVAVLQAQQTSDRQAIDAATTVGKDRTARNTGWGAIVASAGALIWQWVKG
jgi:hypothetical protein